HAHAQLRLPRGIGDLLDRPAQQVELQARPRRNRRQTRAARRPGPRPAHVLRPLRAGLIHEAEILELALALVFERLVAEAETVELLLRRGGVRGGWGGRVSR